MTTGASRTSPIVAIAAGSLIVFSLVGIGVMTGIIPSSRSQNAEPAKPVATAPASEATANAKPEVPAHRKANEAKRTASARTAEHTRVASATPAPAAPAVCAECGTVASVNVAEQKGEGSGLGAVAGGIVGGVLGNQIGGGTGRQIATVAGVAGGALAGHQIEKTVKSTKQYRVAVRMDDGSVRHFTYDAQPQVQPGDKVRVVDGNLVF